jgi:hypothetical protein
LSLDIAGTSVFRGRRRFLLPIERKLSPAGDRGAVRVQGAGYDGGHGVRLPADLAIGEPAQAIAVRVQRELARMVVLERLAAPVRGVAVGLDDHALLAPEEVDDEVADADVRLPPSCGRCSRRPRATCTSPSPAGGRDKRRDIHLHRSPSLTTTATTRHKRIAVNTPARTLTDLRRTIDPALYRKAVREAEFRNLALGAAPTDHTRSELERAFLRLCRRRRLPLPG